jgi:leucyl aminopeptidase
MGEGSGAFTPAPSVAAGAAVRVEAADSVPSDAVVVGVLVDVDTAAGGVAGLSGDQTTAAGFDGSPGSTITGVGDGSRVTIAVGLGDGPDLDRVRDAAAAFARAADHVSDLVLDVRSVAGSVDPDDAVRAAVEGMLLARYRYDVLRVAQAKAPVRSVTIVVDGDHAEAARRGASFASATMLARDLANSPHSHLSASRLADLAVELGPDRGLEVEVFDKDQLVALGCGGLLGVNAGSAEPPRMIKLDYRPAGGESAAHLGLVGKGIMYDSGGLSLKPGDEVHAQMKNDMSGAAAVFAAMMHLAELDCPTHVTAWLMCTDNMPSGTAIALGDVLTMRGGTTVEVINTDAEGRLVMADALVLAGEDGVDAVVDVATLTGACMRALGTELAGVMGNDAGVIEQIEAAAEAASEPVWELPLYRRYRKQLDSPVADLRNLGGANAGAITAALFLAEFAGDVPWAHVDIAGTAQSDGDAGWQTAGCTGFGARLILELAGSFTAPGR